MNATRRSSRWCQKKDQPSLMLRTTSTGLCLAPVVSIAVGIIRGSITAASAPSAKSPALVENTNVADNANRAAPTGGPMKLLMADWVANNRPLEVLALDQSWGNGQRRVVHQGLGCAGEEHSYVEDHDVAQVGDERKHQQPEADGSDQVPPHHDEAPVDPVGQRPGRQGEDQPRQELRYGDPPDQQWIPGQRHGEQRYGRQHEAVAQVRRALRPPQAGEATPQTYLHCAAILTESP
jgi:hypothetical protein